MDIKRWDEISDIEYLQFHRISESKRLSSYHDVCAFLYLEKKFGPPTEYSKDMVTYASHDIFFLGISEKNMKKLTDEDVVFLCRCGCRWNEESDPCLSFFT